MEKQKVTFTYPKDVLEAMRELSREHGRSLIGEIVWALRQFIKLERMQSVQNPQDPSQSN